jgi:hypothetical protein
MEHTTKKKFKEDCDLNHVYGRGQGRLNAIYFNWRETNTGRGFKFAVAARITECTKAELFNIFYDWIVNEVNLPYWVYYKQANDDSGRFKVPISFSGFN